MARKTLLEGEDGSAEIFGERRIQTPINLIYHSPSNILQDCFADITLLSLQFILELLRALSMSER